MGKLYWLDPRFQSAPSKLSLISLLERFPLDMGHYVLAGMSKVVGALLGRKCLDEPADQLHQRATVRAAPLRIAVFSFENAISIGLRSGE